MTSATHTTATSTLPRPVSEYIEASNTFDGDRLIAAFAEDAMVNDARREFWGRDAIWTWADRELIGDRVTFDVRDVLNHHGELHVDGVMDGDFDKRNLPDELILSHYFTIRDDQIVRLIIIRNNPSG
jgi:hypothetical protein